MASPMYEWESILCKQVYYSNDLAAARDTAQGRYISASYMEANISFFYK